MMFSKIGPSSTISCGIGFGSLQIGLAEGVAELPLGQVVGEAERHVAADAGEHVEQHAKALGAARHLVEHHAGAVLLAQDRLGGEADVLLPARALDVADLAEQLGAREPFAQVVVGDAGVDVAFGAAAVVHAKPCPPVTALLRGLDAEHLGDVGELVAHLLDAGGELGRPANVDHLAGGASRCAMVGSAAITACTSAAMLSRSASGIPRGP